MPIFTIQTPSGRKLRIEAGDQATALRGAREFEAGQAGAPVAPESQASLDTRSELSRLTQKAGAGTGGSSVMRSIDSFMRAAADVGTFGLADELSAGAGALTGIGGKFGDYSGNLRRQRIEQEQRDNFDPVASTVGRVGGALLSGYGLAKMGLPFLSGAAPEAGLAGRIGAGATGGAIYGGAYGAGSGEGIWDRVAGAGTGAVTGGMIGGAIPALASGIRTVAKPVTDAISARVNPAAFAARKVEERLSAGNVTPGVVATKMQNNPGLSVADTAGKSARDLLRTASNTPGPARDRIATQIALRQLGQGDRLKAAIGKTLADPDGYLTAKDQLAEAAKKIAGPLYDKAYARPVHFTKTLEDILATPAGRSALAKAQQLAANEQQPFRQVFVNIRGEAKRVPDTRGWDYIKRALDDMIDAQTDPMTRKVTNEGRILTSLKQRMLKEIDMFNPAYKEARGAFSGVAQIDDALEFGRKAMTMSPEAVKRELAGFSIPQKQAARIGAAEELRKAIDGAGWTNNAVLKVMNGRQKFGVLRSLFENETQFAEFRKALFGEVRRRKTYDAVRGNSTTAAQLADMFEAGGANSALDLAGKVGKGGIVHGTLEFVGSRLRRLGGLTPQVADEIAKRLMSVSPADTRQLINELHRIDSAKISAAQKAALVQSLVTKTLTSQTVRASSARP